MQHFDCIIAKVRAHVDRMRAARRVREVACEGAARWPEGRRGNVVLAADTAVELGSPKDASVAFLVLTPEPSLVRDGCVTLVGPDVGEAVGGHLSFGKVALLAVPDVRDDGWYERHRELERVRYDCNLAGYMMRAAAQHGREWSRVSRQAVDAQFSLITLGNDLIRLYRARPGVARAEIVFVTSSADDVRALGAIGGEASRRMDAMHKMVTEPTRECGVCGFSDVCGHVESLRAARRVSAGGRSHV